MVTETIPDARADLAGAVNYLLSEVAALRRERDEQRVNATEAARTLGFSESYIRGRPWRVPGFGLKGRLHSLRAWRAWLDIPEINRRSEWDSMPIAERRKARGLK
jgi:hypothetical protein